MAPQFSTAQEQVIPERRSIASENTDFYGGDIRTLLNTTIEICEAACISDQSCVALTFNQIKSSCFLKNSVSERTPFTGALSLEILDTADFLLALGNERAELLSFLPDSYLPNATFRAANIGRQYPVNGGNLQIMTGLFGAAHDRGDYRRALEIKRQILSYDDSAEAWLDVSRLARTEPNRSRNNLNLATDAAINAFLRSQGPVMQAEILVDLAEILEDNRRGRLAIPALRLAQSIAPGTGIENRLDRVIGLFGFRILDHQVDNNATQPRICINFNESLVEVGVNYADFVRTGRRDLPVNVEDKQLCVDGVQHGERYTLTLRAGMPAASGEVLEKSVDLSIYVRDRDPSVRFLGRAFVLPKGENAAIPVVSVNTDIVELRISRVGERNLLPMLRDGYIGGTINEYSQDWIDNRMGEEIWQGIGEVSRILNADTTTALPLADAINEFEPGIYVMTARVPDVGEAWEDAATQWFIVTDLGIETLMGSDGLHVFVRGLSDANAMQGVTARLIAVNNQVLAEIPTDAQGYAHFSDGYTRGTGGNAPALVQVETALGDFAFINLAEAALDLSDRGVQGRASPPPIDIFMTTERGAYRPGETVFTTILARDTRADALLGLPLTVVVTRPDGVEFTREVLADAGAGGRSYQLELPNGAMRGSWTMRVYANPDDPALNSLRFLVEDFVPERIDFIIAAEDRSFALDEPLLLSIEADYLYGAPAADLAVEGEVEITRAYGGFTRYPGYRFGLRDEPFIQGYMGIQSDTLSDANGMLALNVTLPEMEPTTRPLQLTATLRMADGSGRPVERSITRPILPDGPRIGIKPLFDGALEESALARFEIIAIDQNLDRTDMPEVTWTLSRIERSYQWYRVDGYWNWEPISRRERVADGVLGLSADGIARIEAPVDWGRYELKISSNGVTYTASSYAFEAGWWAADAGSDTPDILDIGLDKSIYAIGETARLRLTPRYAGKALIRVISDRLISMQAVDVALGDTVIELPVTAEWGAGAYVTVTLIRPMDVAAGRNPARAIGLNYATVDPGNRALKAGFDMPAEIAPRGPMQVILNVENASGATFATIAAVDVGILNLTGFESPDPQGHYFGQRKLGMEMRDLYGRLIDGLQGTPGLLRSGGDGSMARSNTPPPTQELVAYFSGPISVGPDGIARASFDMPEFNGTVRLMAVVWSANGIGQAQADILVRDPIVVATALPRFLAPGDQSRILVEIAHAKGPSGPVVIQLETSGEIFIPLAQSTIKTTLDTGQKRSFAIPITAGAAGNASITLVMQLPDGTVLNKTELLSIRANNPMVVTNLRVPLAANGGEFVLDNAIFANLVRGTGSATLTMGPLARFNAARLLQQLDQYPYGCTEQVTSRAMPLLYMGDVAQAMGLAQVDNLDSRIAESITAVLANQSARGSFGLWRPDRGDLWLDAYVSDFLSRARSQGYGVPDTAFISALDNLLNQINYAPDFENGGQDIAYALMVLAREGKASIGDLRYYADTKPDDFATALSLAQLGTALAYYGDQSRADALFTKAYKKIRIRVESDLAFRSDYGSSYRDMAAILTLATEVGSTSINREALARRIAGNDRIYTSTQEDMWVLLAANALVKDADTGNVLLNGVAMDGPPVRRVNDADLSGPAMVFRNNGTAPIDAVLTVLGVPETDEPAQSSGYQIERWTYTLEGEPVDFDNIQQNQRLVAILRITPETNRKGRLMVADPLPAGFEIDNPNLLRSGDIASLDWLNLDAVSGHTEFRDDRFLAAVDWNSGNSFQLAYIIRAISPGVFQQPAASVEDMYRPELRGRTDTRQITVVGAALP
ncbi:MAG: alpha-2-macroglobulin family protein [Rhodobacteraceae bacterium]|nr:alpha-2-macroglobulin family protein [Paracoccaceae bacterium]